MVAFLVATGFSIWTGAELARKQRQPFQPRPAATARASEDINNSRSALTPSQPTESGNITVESCKITMAQVQDPQPPLSIRDRPTPQGNVIGEIANDEIIDVNGSQGDWFSISNPVQGWIPRGYTAYGCNTKIARVEFPRGKKGVELTGTFVGTGIHQYKLRANRNQTITLTSNEGPMPILTSPQETVLFSGPQAGDPESWSGKLPEDGDYILELDSDFRGYTYRFNVQID